MYFTYDSQSKTFYNFCAQGRHFLLILGNSPFDSGVKSRSVHLKQSMKKRHFIRKFVYIITTGKCKYLRGYLSIRIVHYSFRLFPVIFHRTKGRTRFDPFLIDKSYSWSATASRHPAHHCACLALFNSTTK